MLGKLKGEQISSNKEGGALTGQSASIFKPHRVHHIKDLGEELGESQFNGVIPGVGEISNLRKSLKTMMRDRI